MLVLAYGLLFPSTDVGVSVKKKNPVAGLVSQVLNIVPNVLSEVTSPVLLKVKLAGKILALNRVLEGDSHAVVLLDLGVFRPVLQTGLGPL